MVRFFLLGSSYDHSFSLLFVSKACGFFRVIVMSFPESIEANCYVIALSAPKKDNVFIICFLIS